MQADVSAVLPLPSGKPASGASLTASDSYTCPERLRPASVSPALVLAVFDLVINPAPQGFQEACLPDLQAAASLLRTSAPALASDRQLQGSK